MNQAYDQKNSENYEANTLKIENALLQIERNKKLKTTVAQLSKLTGIHRNTINNRKEPIRRLNAIKEARRTETNQSKEALNIDNADNSNSLEQQLTHTRTEVIYWFNQHQDIKRQLDHYMAQYREMKASRDHYKILYQTDHKSLFEAEKEINQLKELLESIHVNTDQLRH